MHFIHRFRPFYFTAYSQTLGVQLRDEKSINGAMVVIMFVYGMLRQVNIRLSSSLLLSALHSSCGIKQNAEK